MRRETAGRARIWPLTAALAVLLGFSAYLAATRIYQVDEFQNVTMARVLAQRREAQFFTDAGAFTAALSGLDRGAARSRDLLANARLMMLALFWLNLVLLGACTGEALASRRGLIALLAAATLAPLWDHGFEIRHDNPLLTCLLLTWYLLRTRPGGRRAYFAAGAVAVAAQLFSFKSFAYMLPLSAAFLLFPPPGHRAPRRALVLCWAAGAAAALAAARGVYGALGLWSVYLSDLRGMSAITASARRFPPQEPLGRLLGETPLLSALLFAALFLVARDLKRRGAAARTWEGGLPEAALFAGAFAVLLVNPTPFSYNILLLIPFAFLVAYRYAARLASELRERRELVPLAWTLVILFHAAPFAAATAWAAMWSSARQVRLMDAAEALTDPSKDPVYDAVGLVPTRPSAAYQWVLTSFTVHAVLDGSGPRVRDLLERSPAAVFIPNYRTDWFSTEDHVFIGRRYVPLSDDFWVLGTALPPGGGGFDVRRAGRYRISTLEDSGLYGASGANRPAPADGGIPAGSTLDGARFAGGVVALAAGRHILKTAAACQAAAVWTGPRLERPPRLGWSDHRRLFVNWY
jgi:hypothetical protein